LSESEVEKQFARDLDSNENVKLFVTSWFKIDTAIGIYNPDWAFITEREEKLYFARETKSSLDSEERRTKENQKSPAVSPQSAERGHRPASSR